MRIVKPAEIKPWKKVGAPTPRGAVWRVALYAQLYENPRTAETHEFAQFHGPGWCNICALTTDHHLLLVRQYKQGIDGVFYEFPAGIFEEGEEIAMAAARELEEETGFHAELLRQLGTTWSSARWSNLHFHSFIATGCREVGVQRLDPLEDIEVAAVTAEEFWALVENHEIRDAATLTTALHAVTHGYLPSPSHPAADLRSERRG